MFLGKNVIIQLIEKDYFIVTLDTLNACINCYFSKEIEKMVTLYLENKELLEKVILGEYAKNYKSMYKK